MPVRNCLTYLTVRGASFEGSHNEAMTGRFWAAWPSTVCGDNAMVASRPMKSRRLIACSQSSRRDILPSQSTRLNSTSVSALGQKRTFARSFDHLIGDGDHPWRHLDAERSRRLKVDDELEFGRLQHWQVGGPGPPCGTFRIEAQIANTHVAGV